MANEPTQPPEPVRPDNPATQDTATYAKALGKKPARGHPLQLLYADFATKAALTPPSTYDFWKGKAPLPARSFGNRTNGCCTRASQAVLSMRMERIEQRRTVAPTDEEVLRVYYEMTARLYGGGDVGAYEIDALNAWRRSDQTFRDQRGRPYTIDAYVRVNHLNADEVRSAICASGAKGIKVCFALPLAWSRIDAASGQSWDAPHDPADPRRILPLTGDWEPGSWGGHSLTADAYTPAGVRLAHTWYDGSGKTTVYHQAVTWDAWSVYADECYIAVDSINAWKKARAPVDLTNLVAEVNRVSSVPIDTKKDAKGVQRP